MADRKCGHIIGLMRVEGKSSQRVSQRIQHTLGGVEWQAAKLFG